MPDDVRMLMRWHPRLDPFAVLLVHGGMPLRCFSLLLGARQTHAMGKRFRREDDALIREITFRHFPDGYTVLHADGGWFDPKTQRFIAEESRQILVCAKSARLLRRWSAELAHALEQRELLVVELGPAWVFPRPPRRPQRHRAARQR
jgi:hypothetical protein